MKRRTALGLPLLLAAGAAATRIPRGTAAAARWSPERAGQWYASQGWPVGANYTPSSAVNQLEMFQAGTFDPGRINTELGWARSIGFNTMRVFLHDQLWAADQQGFQNRLGQFVGIASANGIRPLFVLFDSCWNPHPNAGPQPAPTPGVHNSQWVQGPGMDRIGDADYRKVMQDYVVGVMSQFRNDGRVLGWDVWNEPDNLAFEHGPQPGKLEQVAEVLPQAFAWARSVDASQPLTSGVWEGSQMGGPIATTQLENSDVISFHSYDPPGVFEGRANEMAGHGRPLLCTEYMARPRGSTVGSILPIMKRRNIGAFNWGFVRGKTQTYLPWDSWAHPYTSDPDPWFHDLFHPDGTPYDDGETLTISKLTRG